MQLSAQAFGTPGADAVALAARLEPAGAAARRGLARLRALRRRAGARASATAPACCRIWPISTSSPSSCRSRTAGARMDDIDLDRSRASSATRPPSRRARCANWRRRCASSGTLRRDSSGRAQAHPEGDAAARQVAAEGHRDPDVGPAGAARDCSQAGAAGESSGATRPWEFGDTEPWDIPRTMLNGVRRRAGEGGRAARSRSTTSRSPRPRSARRRRSRSSSTRRSRWRSTTAGCPMKRTALALHTLIRSRFRGDQLQLIGFGRHAEVMDIEQLTALDAMWDKGTNLHHALLLANRHFRKHPNAQPVLLIVTDGEPTSHLEPDGSVSFSYPPHPRTIKRTLDELDNSMRLGAQTTFFRLGDDPGLARFVDSMARRVHGPGRRARARRSRCRRRRLVPRIARHLAGRRTSADEYGDVVRRPRVLGRRLSRFSRGAPPVRPGRARPAPRRPPAPA